VRATRAGWAARCKQNAHGDVLEATGKGGSAAWAGRDAVCTVRLVPQKQWAGRELGTGSRTTSGVGRTRIGSDGKITCTIKSARETGKPASTQNRTAMAGIPPRLGSLNGMI
jgi:hypothetical protein